MSRIGKVPINLPKEVKITIDAAKVALEGPKGKIAINIPQGIKVEQANNQLIVKRIADNKQDRANHGTIKARLVNMIEGVTKGHKRDLEIQGIGFRAQLQGNKIVLNLGLSHPVEFTCPPEVKVAVPTPTAIVIEGVDSVAVGLTAAKIRDLKPAEPYKGKGIRYQGEVVRRKQGKSVTTTSK